MFKFSKIRFYIYVLCPSEYEKMILGPWQGMDRV